jgi:uncharacterized protein YecT (DUF1311 family)
MSADLCDTCSRSSSLHPSIPIHNQSGEPMKRIFSVLLLLSSSAAFANSSCDKPKNDFDGMYCLNKVYQQADSDLNSTYKQLAGKLDADGKAALKQGQLLWIGQRNDRCSIRKGDDFFVNLDCATATTIERTQFLQDRYRECISSGCQNSKL